MSGKIPVKRARLVKDICDMCHELNTVAEFGLKCVCLDCLFAAIKLFYGDEDVDIKIEHKGRK